MGDLLEICHWVASRVAKRVWSEDALGLTNHTVEHDPFIQSQLDFGDL